MRLSLIVLWALVGWCGTLWPWWWWRRRIPIPPPDPFPEPPPEPWLIPRVIGVAGGIIGGWVFAEVFGPGPEPWLTAGPQPDPWLPAIRAASTAVGALIGARLLVDVYGLVRGRGNVTRG